MHAYCFFKLSFRLEGTMPAILVIQLIEAKD